MALRAQRCCRRAAAEVDQDWLLSDDREPADDTGDRPAKDAEARKPWSWDVYRMQVEAEEEEEEEPEPESQPGVADSEDDDTHDGAPRQTQRSHGRDTADGRLATTFLASRRCLLVCTTFQFDNQSTNNEWITEFLAPKALKFQECATV